MQIENDENRESKAILDFYKEKIKLIIYTIGIEEELESNEKARRVSTEALKFRFTI